MNILLDDGMQIDIGTGIGKYSLNLYETLKRHAGEFGAVRLAKFRADSLPRRQRRIRYLLRINSLAYRAMTSRFDVAHFTNYVIPFVRSPKTRYAVTIHDLTSFLHPESLPRAYGIYNRFAIRYALRHADVVLTVSESVRREIAARWPQYAGRVSMVYPGLCLEYRRSESAAGLADRYDLVCLNSLLEKQKYFLFVGTVEKRKNLRVVIEAFLNVKKRPDTSAYKLVLAGRPGFGFEELKTIIDRSGHSEDIIVTGYVTSDDCRRLYRNAAAYVFPSVYEGFGFPQLECMATHLPLILSDIPTNREVSDEYGLFFDKADPDALAEQMMLIVRGQYPYQEKATIADRLLGVYDWDTLAKDYLAAYAG